MRLSLAIILLPLALTGCETMNGWMRDVGQYVPDAPKISAEPATSSAPQNLQKTNTNMYSVPQK